MKYGFYLSPCGDKMAYYYFCDDKKLPTVESGQIIVCCNIKYFLNALIVDWAYLGE